jgi:hypothetical protein
VPYLHDRHLGQCGTEVALELGDSRLGVGKLLEDRLRTFERLFISRRSS